MWGVTVPPESQPMKVLAGGWKVSRYDSSRVPKVADNQNGRNDPIRMLKISSVLRLTTNLLLVMNDKASQQRCNKRLKKNS